MGFFRPEIETALKMIGIAGLITLIVLPVAWGYEQRKQARTWQNVACAYRMKEVARRTPMIATLEYRGNACTTLEQLGLGAAEPFQVEDLLTGRRERWCGPRQSVRFAPQQDVARLWRIVRPEGAVAG